MHFCPLRLLTIKTAFLITITSARQVNELQALSVEQLYTSFYSDKLVLWTKEVFLPKVVMPFHIGKSINLTNFYALPHTSKEDEWLEP